MLSVQRDGFGAIVCVATVAIRFAVVSIVRWPNDSASSGSACLLFVVVSHDGVFDIQANYVSVVGIVFVR